MLDDIDNIPPQANAVDCLPYRLKINKLHAFGIDVSACMLSENYCSNRKQRVKIGTNKRTWSTINGGKPQGLFLGPFIFNCFQYNLRYFLPGIDAITTKSADDNTVELWWSRWNFFVIFMMHVILCNLDFQQILCKETRINFNCSYSITKRPRN